MLDSDMGSARRGVCDGQHEGGQMMENKPRELAWLGENRLHCLYCRTGTLLETRAKQAQARSGWDTWPLMMG